MYASVADMVERFSEGEIITISTPRKEQLAGIRVDRVERALIEATGIADGYLRRRYAVPLTAVPPEVSGATMQVARYLLTQGSGADPSEPMRLAHKQAVTWFGDVADGRVNLEGQMPVDATSGAMASDRGRCIGGGMAGRVMPRQGYDPEWPSTW